MFGEKSPNRHIFSPRRKRLLLKNIGVETDKWIMCYPYGAYNSDTISLLKEKNCSFAVTTKPGIANLKGNHFELPRKDTNNFPQ